MLFVLVALDNIMECAFLVPRLYSVQRATQILYFVYVTLIFVSFFLSRCGDLFLKAGPEIVSL